MRRFVPCVLLLTALGCIHLPLYAAKSLESVEVESFKAKLSPEGQGSFEMQLLVENPNPWKGTLREVDWQVWVKGHWFAAGVEAVNEELLAHGQKILSLRVPVTFVRPLQVLGPAPVTVSVRGQVQADFGLGAEGLLFSESTEMPMPNAPAFVPQEEGG